jgi:hypothetical protein
MALNYITTPPTVPPVFGNIPPFVSKMFRSSAKTYVEKLIAWSTKEYFDMLGYLYTVDLDRAKKLGSYCSNLDFLAHSKAFSTVCTYMTPEIWNVLSWDAKDTIIKARKIMLASSKNVS